MRTGGDIGDTPTSIRSNGSVLTGVKIMSRLLTNSLKFLCSGFNSSLLVASVSVVVLLILQIPASAQTTSSTDGSTPLGLSPGSPSGSYPLSGFESINPYNGNLNFHLPLAGSQGR